MNAYIPKEKVPALVGVLQALGYKHVGAVPLDTYLKSYSHHDSWGIGCLGGLSSYASHGTKEKKDQFAEFVAEAIRLAPPPKGKSWKIGCRTVEVRGHDLFILEDEIVISRTTLEEMLEATK
jgi:hypothetical protein